MRLIGNCPEVCINVRNQFANEDSLEGFNVEIPETAGRAGPYVVCHAVSHHDDERLGLILRDQVVHDPCGAALDGPAIFVFTPAVLKI